MEEQEKKEEKEKHDRLNETEDAVKKPHRMIYHDFDYVNPMTMKPEGLDAMNKT